MGKKPNRGKNRKRKPSPKPKFKLTRKLTGQQKVAKLYSKSKKLVKKQISPETRKARENAARNRYIEKGKAALKRFKAPKRGDLFTIDDKGKKTTKAGYVVRRWGKGFRVVRERVEVSPGKFRGKGFRRKTRPVSIQDRSLGPANKRLFDRERKRGRWKFLTKEIRGDDLRFDSVSEEIDGLFADALLRSPKGGTYISIETEWDIESRGKVRTVTSEISGFIRGDQEPQEMFRWYLGFTHKKMADQLTLDEIVTAGSETFTSTREVLNDDESEVIWDNTGRPKGQWRNGENKRWEKNEFAIGEIKRWKVNIYRLKQ
jgi:hypothetical protein